jgi:hypothetical protein
VQSAFRVFERISAELYNNAAVICPLCKRRKARRGCPALGEQICAVCCGTKRQIEIRCPSDCAWLATAREHPAAAVVRQQQRDVGVLVQVMRDLSESQSQLCFLVLTFLAGYTPGELARVVDEDVAEAAGALASTYETAARGVIYEHRPASLSAERLAHALKPVIAEAGAGRGSAFERDAAVVLRRIVDAIAASRAEGDAPRTFLDLVGRVVVKEPAERAEREAPQASRLIVP